MGIYILLASVVSAVCDITGDDTNDAQTKIRRLVNTVGPGFCKLSNFPFLRADISFSITSSAYTYSGSSYIPENYVKMLGIHIIDNNSEWQPMKEVGMIERYDRWLNPSNNSGTPDEFCMTRNEAAYPEIQFNRIPDGTYTVEAEILQKWSYVTATTGTIIVTDDYMEAFCHYVAISRARQQGDIELYSILKNEWWNPNDPKGSILGNILSGLSSPTRKIAVVPPENLRVPNDTQRTL